MHGNGLVAAGMPLVFGVTEFSIVGERLFVRNLVSAPEHISVARLLLRETRTVSCTSEQDPGWRWSCVECHVPDTPDMDVG